MPTHVGQWIAQRLASGRYQVTAKLGEGGMGAVYRAHDANLDTDVVIKVPHPHMLRDSEFATRFSREIRSLVQLSHPHIVTILDVGQHDELPFAVMQYLPGGSLEDRRVRASSGQVASMSPQEIAEWLEDVSDALDFIHKQGYVHRDIKPGNILFDAHGNVFLSDFGVAKAIASESEGPQTSQLTGTGMVLGTPDYMAPEVILGKPYDGRADQYALAVTLFELLAGRLPFVGPTPTAVLVAHSTQPPPDLREICPQVPVSLAAVIHKGLAKDPVQRYPTCKALALAFQGVLRHPGAATAATVIRHNCPVCRQVLRVAGKAAGQCVPCPACKTRLQVSPDRQEITVAGRGRTVRTTLPVAEPLTGTDKTPRPRTGTMAPPSILTLPAAATKKRTFPVAYVGGAVLALGAVVLVGLLLVGRSEKTGPTGVAAAPSTKIPAASEPNAGQAISRPAVGSEQPAPAAGSEPPKSGPGADLPKSPDSGRAKPIASATTLKPPVELATAKPTDSTTSKAGASSAPKPGPEVNADLPKMPQPKAPSRGTKPVPFPPDEQLAIGRMLDRQHEVANAETPAEKKEAAGSLCSAAKARPRASAERFVALRLAIELFDEAGSPEMAKTAANDLQEDFGVDASSLDDRLLDSLWPHLPSGKVFSDAFYRSAEDPAQWKRKPDAQSVPGARWKAGYVRPDKSLVLFHDKNATKPRMAIEYGEALSDGLVRAWNEERQLTYCCQYNDGKREGLCCVMENGQPRLAIEYRDDQFQGAMLLAGWKTEKSYRDLNGARADPVAAAKLAELDKIAGELDIAKEFEEIEDRVMKTAEAKEKREAQKLEAKEKQKRVSEYTRGASKRINAGMRQHAAEREAGMRAVNDAVNKARGN